MNKMKDGKLNLQKGNRLLPWRKLIYEEMISRRPHTPMAVIEGNRFTIRRAGEVMWNMKVPWSISMPRITMRKTIAVWVQNVRVVARVKMVVGNVGMRGVCVSRRAVLER